MAPGARGLLLDLDGTVYTEAGPIPGAREALAAVRAAGLPLAFVTNTTRKPRSAILAHLRKLGVEAARGEVLTAPVAAAAWLCAEGARRVGLLVPRATWEDFEGLDLTGPEPGPPGGRGAEAPGPPVDHLVVGDLGEAWDAPTLNWGFRHLLAGARLVAIQKNRFWETGSGLALDAGAFVAALEYASGREATVVGKPSRAFFEAAVGGLGVPAGRCVMVGDDLESDVAGAREAGLVGVLVKTGKFRLDGRDEGEARGRADAVLESIAELPGWLGLA